MEEMPVKFEIKVVKVGESLKVTIPIPLSRHLGLKKGDTVMMWANNGNIIMEKEKSIN
jgi:bifunctional DNA-binding transcriptional regulator/antitoxin component of YhaV-PrlF toxin-antitoxin module